MRKCKIERVQIFHSRRLISIAFYIARYPRIRRTHVCSSYNNQGQESRTYPIELPPKRHLCGLHEDYVIEWIDGNDGRALTNRTIVDVETDFYAMRSDSQATALDCVDVLLDRRIDENSASNIKVINYSPIDEL